MILIITNRTDQTADWLILELERRAADYVRFNTEDFPTAASLVWDGDGATTLAWADTRLDLNRVSAVWYCPCSRQTPQVC